MKQLGYVAALLGGFWVLGTTLVLLDQVVSFHAVSPGWRTEVGALAYLLIGLTGGFGLCVVGMAGVVGSLMKSLQRNRHADS